jgi:nucleoside-diphosphate-sugar epimerase
MRVLFIGGTGNISTDCTKEALAQGYQVCHLNRGQRPSEVAADVTTFRADVRNPEQVRQVLADEEFDCVVDFIAFTPDHVQADIDLFAGRTGQFIFISSASAYHKPPRHYVITESTPLSNPYWQYSRSKIACEELLTRAYRESGFPATVVRPSHTYSVGWLPTSFGSADFTVPQRILDGKPIVVHGDGTSLWTLTHTMDFARAFTGLLGNPAAIGETFHITSDEVLTWNQIHHTIAGALGRSPNIVHVPSEKINEVDPKTGAALLGDKAHSVVFDNTKIKRFVPGFEATIPFYRGVRMSLDFLNRHADLRSVDPQTNALIDSIIETINVK